jgi:hypothetical protein
MSFKKRNNLIVEPDTLILNAITESLKNKLWNVIELYFLNYLDNRRSFNSTSTQIHEVVYPIWHNIKKDIISNIEYSPFNVKVQLRQYFFSCEWGDAFEVLESIILSSEEINPHHETFIDGLNHSFESEYYGYRVIDKMVSPITDEIELEAIKSAITDFKYEEPKTHLKKAIGFLSDRINPDYANSIKESISAVESICRIITNENSFDSAINKLESLKLLEHKRMKEAVNKLFAYTNDKSSGIRHAIVEEHTPPKFEDAQFILVTCSAFINYITIKTTNLE